MTTKLALKLMVRDEELRAIGHVAVQWAYLETELDYISGLLTSHEHAKELEISHPQSFSKRMENIKKYAAVILKDCSAAREELLAIANDASSLRGFRDDIVHGHWKLKRTKNGLTTGLRVINQRSSLKVRDMVFTAEKAEEIAAKISAVSLKATMWHQKYVSFESAS